MQRVMRIASAVVLLLLCAAVSHAVANRSPQDAGTVQTPELKTITGELVKVDVDNQTLNIKVTGQEENEEMQFQYNKDTTVEGRENGVQGLSSESGIQVTVYFSEEDGKRIATRIEIKKTEG